MSICKQALPFTGKYRQPHIAAFDEQIASALTPERDSRRQKGRQDKLNCDGSNQRSSRPVSAKKHSGRTNDNHETCCRRLPQQDLDQIERAGQRMTRAENLHCQGSLIAPPEPPRQMPAEYGDHPSSGGRCTTGNQPPPPGVRVRASSGRVQRLLGIRARPALDPPVGSSWTRSLVRTRGASVVAQLKHPEPRDRSYERDPRRKRQQFLDVLPRLGRHRPDLQSAAQGLPGSMGACRMIARPAMGVFAPSFAQKSEERPNARTRRGHIATACKHSL
jgi:hypothetical protein